MKRIPLTQGKFALVDDEYFDILTKVSWQYTKKGYARSSYGIRMHRFILNALKGIEVDHKNGNKLDNRKNNLRLCTHSQNIMNSKSRIGKVKGIYLSSDRRRWVASLMLNQKQIYLGRFNSKETASLVYRIFSRLYFGEYAYFARGKGDRSTSS